MLNYILILLASLAVCYLIGSVNFAMITARICAHKDVRTDGSGNAGMTNVIRTVGLKAGLVTFVGDMLKGVAALMLVKHLLLQPFYAAADGQISALLAPEYALYICGAACMLGHIFPLYYQFRGGKGVSTAIGVLFCINWQAAAFVLATFLILLIITKMVSIGSVMGAVEWIIYSFIYAADKGIGLQLYTTLLAAVIGGLVIIKHKDNIIRLHRGEEKMLSTKKK